MTSRCSLSPSTSSPRPLVPSSACKRACVKLFRQAPPSVAGGNPPIECPPRIPQIATAPPLAAANGPSSPRGPSPLASPSPAASSAIAPPRINDALDGESALVSNLAAKASRAQQVLEVLNAPDAQRVTLAANQTPPAPTAHAVYLAERGALVMEANHLKPVPPARHMSSG